MKDAAAVLFAIAAVGLIVARAAGWVPFTWLETAGVVTGAACVMLVVRRSIWNFPVGIVSCAAYLVFFAEGRLYADAGLQIVFIVLGIHGWVSWARGRTDSISIQRIPLGELTAVAAAFPAGWLGLTRLLEHFNGAAPVYDAFVTTLSLAAQWLLNRRYVESWLGWIVVDQVSVILFWSRGMYLTAMLYALFLAMCVAGLVEWRRTLGEVHR
jgi:nicotinamide mononucleotide transporter